MNADLLRERRRIAALARVVQSYEAQQERVPGYQNDVMMAVVDAELRKLETETLRENGGRAGDEGGEP